MRKVGVVFILILSLFIINSLVRSIYNLLQKQEVVVATKEELTTEKKKNAALKEQYRRVQNEGYIEEEARNKLFLAKPGEQIVIVSGDEATTSGEMQKEVQRMQKPHWQAWWELFF